MGTLDCGLAGCRVFEAFEISGKKRCIDRSRPDSVDAYALRRIVDGHLPDELE
jgi:hypothetical protein